MQSNQFHSSLIRVLETDLCLEMSPTEGWTQTRWRKGVEFQLRLNHLTDLRTTQRCLNSN